jgi:hypothetical protein
MSKISVKTSQVCTSISADLSDVEATRGLRYGANDGHIFFSYTEGEHIIWKRSTNKLTARLPRIGTFPSKNTYEFPARPVNSLITENTYAALNNDSILDIIVEKTVYKLKTQQGQEHTLEYRNQEDTVCIDGEFIMSKDLLLSIAEMIKKEH